MEWERNGQATGVSRKGNSYGKETNSKFDGSGNKKTLCERERKKLKFFSLSHTKHEMASVIYIYAGLVGPKSENVEKVLVFKAFLKGQRSHE